ncbi:hypothetical protein POM88_043007 [Heracleum sosnowskyi]|uniref:HAT C-terminal dimerisation domain-containing protein n=1 Tax=Heracleum sosnowskyi TaxID=360622 RepID=A0AAD8HHQ2_9APIA|nr:hypothetical protein POM88_043007 [Heracleum sosnowskyi]
MIQGANVSTVAWIMLVIVQELGQDGTSDSASKTINKEKRQRRLLENYMQQRQLETTEKKNDVDIYLAEEPLNPMIAQFDILLWWKDNASGYKTLSMIYKDILVIPVSTVASESVFCNPGIMKECAEPSGKTINIDD